VPNSHAQAGRAEKELQQVAVQVKEVAENLVEVEERKVEVIVIVELM